MKTTTIQVRLAAILAKCAPLDPVTTPISVLEGIFQQEEIIVLPTTMGYNYTANEPLLNGKAQGHTTHDVLFTFMDQTDGTHVDMRTVGVCNDSSSRLSMAALQTARCEGLKYLFCKGYIAEKMPVSADVPPTPEAVKEEVNKSLPDGVPTVTTGDQVAVPKPKPAPTKKEVADQTGKLLAWQNAVKHLSAENPGDWDAHRLKLKELDFIGKTEKGVLLAKMIEQANAAGVDYDREKQSFFLMELPVLD